MINISNYINTPLSFKAFGGLAILGILGYRAVRWVINKCSSTEKIHRTSARTFEVRPTPASVSVSLFAAANTQNKAAAQPLPLMKFIESNMSAAFIKRRIFELGYDVHVECDGKNAFQVTAHKLNNSDNFSDTLKYLYIFKMLVDAGAHVPSHDTTAPFLLSSKAMPGFTVLLIQGKVDVNVKDETGRTALHYAIENANKKPSQEECSQIEQHIKTAEDREAWEAVKDLMLNCDAVTPLLAAGAAVNVHDKKRQTPLMLAAENGDVDIVKQLLQARAEVNVQDNDGLTPLMYAAKGENESVIRELLQAGAHANAANHDGLTPLMYAASAGSPRAVKELLEAGAQVNVTTKKGWTPLMYAANDGSADTVKELLEARAQVNVWNVNGWTPLMLAVNSHRTNTPAIALLVQAGANLHARQSDGMTAYDLARTNNLNEENIKQLEPWRASAGPLEGAYAPVMHVKQEEKRNWSNILILSPFADNGLNNLDEFAGLLANIQGRHVGKEIFIIKVKGTLNNAPTPSDLAKLARVDENTKVYILGHGSKGSSAVAENPNGTGTSMSAEEIATFLAQHAPALLNKATGLHVRSINCQGAGSSGITALDPSFCEALCTKLYQKGIKAVVRGSVPSIVMLIQNHYTRKTMTCSTRYPAIKDRQAVSYHEAYSKKEFFIDDDGQCRHYFIDYPITPHEFQKELKFFTSLFDSLKNARTLRQALEKRKLAPKEALFSALEYRFLDHPDFLNRAMQLLNQYSPITRNAFYEEFSRQLALMAQLNPQIIPLGVQTMQHLAIVDGLKDLPELQIPGRIEEYYQMNPFFIKLLPEKLNNDAEFLAAVKRNGRVLLLRPECFKNQEMLDSAIDNTKEVLWYIADVPLLMQTLQRRPELFKDIVMALSDFYELSTDEKRLELATQIKQAFPNGIMQTFYAEHTKLLCDFLATLDDEQVLPKECFFIPHTSPFWKSRALKNMILKHPTIFALFSEESSDAHSTPCQRKHARKRYFKTTLRMCRHDVRLLQYVPFSAWKRKSFQQAFLKLAKHNPDAYLHVNMSKEQAKKLWDIAPDFYNEYRSGFLRQIKWTKPACVQAAMLSGLNEKIVEDDARWIVGQFPSAFPHLGTEVRKNTKAALVAVRKNGLLLEHVLLPTRASHRIVEEALASHPDAWKYTV